MREQINVLQVQCNLCISADYREKTDLFSVGMITVWLKECTWRTHLPNLSRMHSIKQVKWFIYFPFGGWPKINENIQEEKRNSHTKVSEQPPWDSLPMRGPEQQKAKLYSALIHGGCNRHQWQFETTLAI